MDVLRFAKVNGVKFGRCGAGWGGPYGYTSPDYPATMIAGFKSHREAAESWLCSLGFNEAGIKILREALERTA